MSHDWNTYYKKHSGIILSNIILHWQYLLSIVRVMPRSALEIGCGPADHTIFLSKILPFTKFSILDFDKKIVAKLKKEYANKLTGYYYCDVTSKEMVNKMKFSKKQFDVIYSQGLLEHFNKKDCVAIIENFAPFAKKHIISIPSDKYPTHDFGNEILRSKKEIISILKLIPNLNYKIQYYFPDVSIRTKLSAAKKDKLGFIATLKQLMFVGCHLLIEIKY